MIPRIPVPTSPSSNDQPLRLNMRPAGDRPAGDSRGTLDGAWWPHSRNLATELPALLAGLDAWLDTPVPRHGAYISRISINLTAWDAVPGHLDHTGRRVRLSWFGAVDAHTLSATSSDGNHLDLLVVPPQATAEQARTATATATDPVNTQRGAAILAHFMPDLLRGPDPTSAWADSTDQASRDRMRGGPARLVDDGDPDDGDPDDGDPDDNDTGLTAATWR